MPLRFVGSKRGCGVVKSIVLSYGQEPKLSTLEKCTAIAVTALKQGELFKSKLKAEREWSETTSHPHQKWIAKGLLFISFHVWCVRANDKWWRHHVVVVVLNLGHTHLRVRYQEYTYAKTAAYSASASLCRSLPVF